MAENKQAHWIDDGPSRNKFWRIVHEKLGLSAQEALEALGIEHTRDYTGSLESGLYALRVYVDKKAADTFTDREALIARIKNLDNDMDSDYWPEVQGYPYF